MVILPLLQGLSTVSLNGYTGRQGQRSIIVLPLSQCGGFCIYALFIFTSYVVEMISYQEMISSCWRRNPAPDVFKYLCPLSGQVGGSRTACDSATDISQSWNSSLILPGVCCQPGELCYALYDVLLTESRLCCSVLFAISPRAWLSQREVSVF